jgi:uncharacterized membrane protein YhhN
MPPASLTDPLIVLAILAFVIYWLAYCTLDRQPMAASIIKTASIGLLAVASLATPSLWPISLGLACGALGDFALSRPGTRAFLAGMAAFALGHLAYALAFLAQGAQIGFTAPSLTQITLGLTIIALVASTELWLAPRTVDLRAPVRAYGLIIGLMALTCLILPAHPGQITLRIGVALFVISDALLALRLFIVADPRLKTLLSALLWPAYWLGQALIFIGAGSYWGQ